MTENFFTGTLRKKETDLARNTEDRVFRDESLFMKINLFRGVLVLVFIFIKGATSGENLPSWPKTFKYLRFETKKQEDIFIMKQLQLQLQYFIVSSQYIYETLTISNISIIQTLIRKRERERKKERKKRKK